MIFSILESSFFISHATHFEKETMILGFTWWSPLIFVGSFVLGPFVSKLNGNGNVKERYADAKMVSLASLDSCNKAEGEKQNNGGATCW